MTSHPRSIEKQNVSHRDAGTKTPGVETRASPPYNIHEDRGARRAIRMAKQHGICTHLPTRFPPVQILKPRDDPRPSAIGPTNKAENRGYVLTEYRFARIYIRNRATLGMGSTPPGRCRDRAAVLFGRAFAPRLAPFVKTGQTCSLATWLCTCSRLGC